MPTPTAPPSSQPVPARHLEDGAHQPHRPPGTTHQPGHQAVARPRPELRPTYIAAGHAVEQDPADQQRQSGRPGAGGGPAGRAPASATTPITHRVQPRCRDRAAAAAAPRAAAPRRPSPITTLPKVSGRCPGEASVAARPTGEPEPAAHQHRHRDAVQRQPGDELDQPARPGDRHGAVPPGQRSQRDRGVVAHPLAILPGSARSPAHPATLAAGTAADPATLATGTVLTRRVWRHGAGADPAGLAAGLVLTRRPWRREPLPTRRVWRR